jgi:hypothetical protein
MKSGRISLKAELDSRVGAGELLKQPGDAVIVTRGQPRWLLLRCPCGCGDEVPVNLDARSGKAWRIYRGEETGLTLFPSVWRDTGCESHFVIWRDQILLFGSDWRTGSPPRDRFDVADLSTRVLSAWPHGRFASYVEVADTLREIPWDVQEACRELVRSGALDEGKGDLQGNFRRARRSRRDIQA